MAKKKEFSQETIDQVKKLFDENYTFDEMCDILNLKIRSLKNIINDLALQREPVRKNKKQTGREFDEEVIKLKEAGLTIAEIAEKLNVGKGIIDQVSKRIGGFGGRKKVYKSENIELKCIICDSFGSKNDFFEDSYCCLNCKPKLIVSDLNATEKEFSQLFYDNVKKLFHEGYGSRKIGNFLGENRYFIQKAFDELGGLKQTSEGVANRSYMKKCTGCGFIGHKDEFEKHRNLCDACYKSQKTIMHRKYKKERMIQDIEYRLRENLSGYIRSALKRFLFSKNGVSFTKYLPYSISELKAHIEKQFKEPGNEWMNWNNWGKYISKEWKDNDKTTHKWQLDHIIPHFDLSYDSMDHPNFKKAWALENLRPLSAKQNNLDGANRIRHKNKEIKKKRK